MATFSSPSVLYFVIILVTSLLDLSSSQDMEKLKLELSKLQQLKDTVADFPNYQELVQTSQTALQSLWTTDLYDRLQNERSLSPQCNKSIEYIFSDVSRLVPMIDALGKPGAGIFGGNTYLQAAFDECFNYNYTAFCFSSKVIVLRLPKMIQMLPWRVGMCVPKYCTPTDIAGLLNATGELVVANTSIYCTNTKTPEYSIGAKVMIVVSSLFVALVLIGSGVDTILQVGESYKKDVKSVSINAIEETVPLLSKEKPKQKKVRPLDFILAFSLFKTVPTLLATQERSGVITSLNGIRVISMTWVILGHTYAFALSATPIDNLFASFSVASRFTFQAVSNAFFSVDSFFFLSGVLVAYLTLKEMKKKNGRFPALQYYIHRYLRITPTYAFVIFFSSYLSVHLAVGPYLSLIDTIGPACKKYWWTNLLYINNLYPWKLGEECLGWGWYLANDMQFYVIAPAMIIAAYYFLPAGIIIAAVLVLSGFTIDGVITGVFDFQANELSQIAYQYSSKPNITQTYMDAIYGKPWDRISPYVVGLALGYILYKNFKIDSSNKIINWLFYGSLWVVATFTAFWLVYGLYFTWHGHIPHTAENVIYIMLSRFLWACCLALLVYACHHGYGWVVNSFLSMKMWTPLARLTFNAYLIHPVVIFTIYEQFQTATHYTDITIAVYFVAFVALSYGAAGILYVAVEMPLGTIEMLIFQLVGLNQRGSQRHNTIVPEKTEKA